MNPYSEQNEKNFLASAAAIWGNKPLRPLILFAGLMVFILSLLCWLWVNQLQSHRLGAYQSQLENHVLRLAAQNWQRPDLDAPQDIKNLYADLQQNLYIEIEDMDEQHILLQMGLSSLREDSLFKSRKIEFQTLFNNQYYRILAIRPPFEREALFTALPYVLCVFLFGLLAFLTAVQTRRLKATRTVLASATHASQTHDSLVQRLQNLESENTELQKTEQEIATLIDSVSDVIFECDTDGKILYVNQVWEKLTGQKPQKALGVSLYDYLQPSDIEGQKERMQRLAAGRRLAQKSEVQLYTVDGQTRVVELSLNRLRLTQNKELRVVGTITDIQDRVQAEQALREAERKYRTIVQEAVSGMYQSSPLGYFISVNPAMARILGYESPEDLIANVRDIGTEFYARPDSRSQILEDADERKSSTGVEVEVLKKDGSIIWIRETFRIVHNPDGTLSHYEGMIEDISEKKRAETALIEAKRQSDMASRAKSEFLANMSHELRTPLNAIIGFSEILKEQIFGKIEHKEYVEYAHDIHASGRHLLEVINEILDFSKIEAGKRELYETALHIEPIAESAIRMIQHKADQQKITLINQIDASLPRIRAEELGMKQILINLLTNAVKFTDAGGKVTLSAAINDIGGMDITVSDTGIGMAEDDIEKALSPFGQINSAFNRKESGTGLGLSLVKSLTELHQGELLVRSAPNEGTDITIRLPAFRTIQDSTAE